jgi:hypothetical protein
MRWWFVFMVIAGLPLGSVAAADCNAARPGKVFEALRAIDDSGEERLRIVLGKLSRQEGWSQSDWEDYTLSLSDNPLTNAMEDRRNDLVAKIFGALARPPLDCEKLDTIEAEILDIERRQWDDAVRRAEERLHRGTGARGSELFS